MREVSVQCEALADSVAVSIRDSREDVCAAFADLSEEERRALAKEAWSIGLRAIMRSRKEADEARLSEVGHALGHELEEKMKGQLRLHEEWMVHQLKRYFDPNDGEISGRLSRFVEDQGPLARLLEKYVAPNHSVLAETLAEKVGEGSPLFRELDPEAREGLVQKMRVALDTTLADNRKEMARALDPTTEGGAVSRFLAHLRTDLERADNDRQKQLVLATAALDTNNENSPLSKLVRETQGAQKLLLTALNPEAVDSPLAILKGVILSTLKAHADTQSEAMRTLSFERTKMDAEIREALARLEERRTHEALGISGGAQFEDAVFAVVKGSVAGGPHIAEETGNTVGLRTHCKKGDLVVRFTEESTFFGSSLVVEAKRDASYGVKKALKELDEARENRGAQAGLFVMARDLAPNDFPSFARYGNNILCTWSGTPDDAALNAALFCALALAGRRMRREGDGDLRALEKIEQRVATEIGRLATMRKCTDNIRKNADELAHEISIADKRLSAIVEDAKRTLRALNVELHEEEIERSSPIRLPRARSLELPGLTLAKQAANE